jgi:hypothetical protein
VRSTAPFPLLIFAFTAAGQVLVNGAGAGFRSPSMPNGSTAITRCIRRHRTTTNLPAALSSDARVFAPGKRRLKAGGWSFYIFPRFSTLLRTRSPTA